MLVLVAEANVAINIQFIQYNSIIFHRRLREPFDSFYSVKTRKIEYKILMYESVYCEQLAWIYQADSLNTT